MKGHSLVTMYTAAGLDKFRHLTSGIASVVLWQTTSQKAEPEIRRDIKKAHKLPEPEELPGHRRIPRVHHGNQPGGDGI
jgi:hypothetical protein